MHSITEVIRHFKKNWTEEISETAITQACREAGITWNDSKLNPIATIQIFFLQILHGNTACEHLSHLAGISFTAGAYCKARMRFPHCTLAGDAARRHGHDHQDAGLATADARHVQDR